MLNFKVNCSSLSSFFSLNCVGSRHRCSLCMLEFFWWISGFLEWRFYQSMEDWFLGTAKLHAWVNHYWQEVPLLYFSSLSLFFAGHWFQSGKSLFLIINLNSAMQMLCLHDIRGLLDGCYLNWSFLQNMADQLLDAVQHNRAPLIASYLDNIRHRVFNKFLIYWYIWHYLYYLFVIFICIFL